MEEDREGQRRKKNEVRVEMRRNAYDGWAHYGLKGESRGEYA